MGPARAALACHAYGMFRMSLVVRNISNLSPQVHAAHAELLNLLPLREAVPHPLKYGSSACLKWMLLHGRMGCEPKP